MIFKRTECIGEGLTGFNNKFFHDNWKLSEEKSGAEEYDATVPGNVRIDLMKADIIPDPFLKKNNEESKWVSKSIWNYRNYFKISPWINEISKKFGGTGILHTVFDAIDYDASFYFDGHFITRQTGMFSTVDIACGIIPSTNANQEISLQIRFHRQPWWRTHALKAQMAFGWDFAPEIRTIGMWRPIRQSITGTTFFTELFAYISQNNSQLIIRGTIKALDPTTMNEIEGSRTAKIKLTLPDLNYNKDFTVEIQSGKEFQLNLGQMDVPLWYPWSLGNPNRIPIQIKLIIDEILTDEYRGYIVNRQVQWIKNPGTFPGNENWTLKINNKKMFLRGINWVPPDSLFGRLSGERYRKLIDMALDANIDIFRVWGGGIEEKTEFYDYCDEKGIMIWQEFPFACTNYPRDPDYIKIAEQECNTISKRTRRHPSLIAYCGGNEFNPYINSHIISIVKNATSNFAPDRYCFSASPFLGDDHNWKVWGYRRMYEGYDINGVGLFQMLTEFGMQAAPNLETIQNILDGLTLDLSSISDLLIYHKADLNGFNHYAKNFSRSIDDIPSLINISQKIQAYALKYAIETCRSAWPNVSGLFPWQFSDPWPNISWSVIDYNFRPKLSYKMIQSLYAPVLPMIVHWKKTPHGAKNEGIRTGQLVVHNGTQSEFHGQVKYEIFHTKNNSKELELPKSKTYKIKVSPERPLKICDITTNISKGTVIKMKLIDENNQIVAKNFDFPSMEPPVPHPKVKKIREFIDTRIDGWWRKYMIKLMELERFREENKEWIRRKPEYTTN